MAVELDGSVRMSGDSGPGVAVRVEAVNRRLRLVSGTEVLGDWNMSDIGISALQDGFTIKAEGEQFILRTADDAALAEEIGILAASPRLARRLAARHNPEERPLASDPLPISSNLSAVGLAVAGAMVILGGSFLGDFGGGSNLTAAVFPYWLAFVVGGILMIAAAYILSTGVRWARLVATALVVGMILVFGFAVRETEAGAGILTAYGFIAGGLVVAIAILVGGGLPTNE